MKLSVFYAAAVSLVVVLGVECRSHGRSVDVEPQSVEPHRLSSTLPPPQPVVLHISNSTLPPPQPVLLQLTLEIQETQMKIDEPSCPAGFFSAGGSDQCYRLYDDINRTWEEANNWCQSKNLRLAETEVPVALRSHLVYKLGVTHFTWMGARGNNNSQMWLSGKVLNNSDPSWWPWTAHSKKSSAKNCLILDSTEELAELYPNNPYYAFACNSKLLTLCKQDTATATPCTCGITNIQRIVGGADVDPARKYPWQVRVGGCGGTIINNRWILTAAHCITNADTEGIFDCKLRDDVAYFTVVVGDHNRYETTDDDSNTRDYTINTFHPHPDWIRNCGTLKYDFALLELNEAIPFNNVIRPICLPKDDSKTYAGQTGTATGWGRASDGSSPNTLQEIQVPILANDQCYHNPDVMICASGEADKNICFGDSGGPIAVIENNKYVQVGVSSFVYGQCSAPYPGVFARVSKVLPWIATTTANGETCG